MKVSKFVFKNIIDLEPREKRILKENKSVTMDEIITIYTEDFDNLDKRFKDTEELRKGINKIFDKESIGYKVSDNEPLDIIKLNSPCFKEVKKKILGLLEKE